MSETDTKTTINLVLDEDLVTSLGYMLDRQNFELLKVVSNDQILHLMSLLRFYYYLPNKVLQNREELE